VVHILLLKTGAFGIYSSVDLKGYYGNIHIRYVYYCNKTYMCVDISIWLQVKTVFPKSWIFFNRSILSNLIIAVLSLSFVSPLAVTVYSLHQNLSSRSVQKRGLPFHEDTVS